MPLFLPVRTGMRETRPGDGCGCLLPGQLGEAATWQAPPCGAE